MSPLLPLNAGVLHLVAPAILSDTWCRPLPRPSPYLRFLYTVGLVLYLASSTRHNLYLQCPTSTSKSLFHGLHRWYTARRLATPR